MVEEGVVCEDGVEFREPRGGEERIGAWWMFNCLQEE